MKDTLCPSPFSSLEEYDNAIAFHRRRIEWMNEQIQDHYSIIEKLREQRAELARNITLKKMEATS